MYERKREIEAENLRQIKSKTCVACIDNCWNHARNAEGATTSVAVDGKILFTFTDKDDAEAKMAVAASKEPLLFRKAVHKIIHDARVDVAAVCIDPKCN